MIAPHLVICHLKDEDVNLFTVLTYERAEFGRKGATGPTNESCMKETGNEYGRISTVGEKIAPLTLES
jgi:hypothetical protein